MCENEHSAQPLLSKLHRFVLNSLVQKLYTTTASQGARFPKKLFENEKEKDTEFAGFLGIPTEFGKWVIW
jgi:hypothetical protein